MIDVIGLVLLVVGSVAVIGAGPYGLTHDAQPMWVGLLVLLIGFIVALAGMAILATMHEARA